MNHPLNTNRYARLAEKLDATLTLINHYLQLRINQRKKEGLVTKSDSDMKNGKPLNCS